MSDLTKYIKTKFLGLIIVLLILSGCLLLVFLGKLGYKELFKTSIQVEYYQKRVTAEINRMNAVIEAVQKTPQDLAYILEFHDTSKDEVKILLESVLFNNPELYGSAIAFEPYSNHKDTLFDSRYMYRNVDQLVFTNLNDSSYNYFYRDWYLIPKTLNKAIWSEPYYDEGGGYFLMSTYSVPFYKFDGKDEKFYGIVTVDVSIEWLTRTVEAVGRTLNGKAYLISENGTILSAPNKDLIFHETLFTLAKELNLPVLRKIGRELQHGKSGHIKLEKVINNEQGYAFYAPIKANKWGLIILIPKSELFKE